jgi:5'-3' exonuclease
VDVYLVDGTYELFRYFFAVPSQVTRDGREVGATRGVLGSLLGMLEGGVRHIGVVTDKVIESFRNDLWPFYKTGEGVDPRLMSQFPLIEEGLSAMGVAVWPMVELEADDGLAAAASFCAGSAAVGRVYICSPDKDLAQCVQGERVVLLDRRRKSVLDEAAVVAKFGVPPRSIPDYLALVGDSADGYPGLAGFGARSAGALLGRFRRLEDISADWEAWPAEIRRRERLSETLRRDWDQALLFRDLATLRTSSPRLSSAEELRWPGPRPDFATFCAAIEAPGLSGRAEAAARKAR